jgi:hypothetical protein
MINSYIDKIASITKCGDAREESYYSALARLLEDYSVGKRNKKIQVTILPKKTEAGNPDFRVWGGRHTQVGYIEAKPPGTNLDDIESSEQLTRYLATFPNLILTDFYEFRLYRKGQLIDQVLLARHFIPSRLRHVPPAEHIEEFYGLLEKFFDFSLPTKFTAETLARELAVRTRFLRDEVIKEELREGSPSDPKKILGFYEAFKKHLISHLTQDDFADLYAQTITYGLFAARTRADKEFDRRLAYDLIPKTIGILREIFHFISFDPPAQMEATVDDIAEVLSVADVRKILKDYFERGKGSDPIFHFYETFLAAYNPEEREKRGVYYTPEPVVSYIVRSLHGILKKEFGREDGFATPSVTVLDPAAGTLTFLAEAAKLAVQEYVEKYGKGSAGQFIKDHVLEHFFAFELMMAPYAAGHLKMGFLLEELGHKLTGDERFPFYLTNTLEMEELAQSTLPGMRSLSEESHLAAKIKKERPILVILGNPPYSGISANASERIVEVTKGQKYITGYQIGVLEEKGRRRYSLIPQESEAKKDTKVRQKTWIGELIEHYKIVDGQWFGERKHWLQDDYVKFFRFIQWKIDQVGEGAVGLITNHSYLDNPTFRGMRQSLMNSFDEIDVLDLHGNSLKKEKAPDGSADKNVFDIQQGVAIILMVKKAKRTKACTVRHADLWGLREEKYTFLSSHDSRTIKKGMLRPSPPYYFFVPTKDEHKEVWEGYPRIVDIFPVNVTGIVTARDQFVIDIDKARLQNRIMQFRHLSTDDEFIRLSYKLKDTRGWKLSAARKKLAQDDRWDTYFARILYRPFDIRWIYYTPTMVDWGRPEVMRHMLQPNLSLVLPRRVETAIPWSHIFLSESIIEHVAVSLKTIDYCFPLYLYPDTNKRDLFSGNDSRERVPNIAPWLFAALAKAYKKPPKAEAIFNYIYGIFFSSAYRKKYEEPLKIDFPRVPLTADFQLFRHLADKGEELADFHLLQSKKLDKPVSRCEGPGGLSVGTPIYDGKRKRIYLNREKYFSPVSRDVWEYRVGGYQVAQKWLKDRKGKTLSSEDVSHYCRVLTALAETIRIQPSLDDLFAAVEERPLKVASPGAASGPGRRASR